MAAQHDRHPADAYLPGYPAGDGDSLALEDQAGRNHDAASEPPASKRRSLGCLVEIVQTLVLTIVVFWLIQTFVAQPFKVEQHSMDTTLAEGQYVLVDKISPRFDSYSRGDIVVLVPMLRAESCSAAGERIEFVDNAPFIKRVIGEPGDLIEIRGRDVYVNGAALDEPYVLGETSGTGDATSWRVPDDRVFVMGDNREQSEDSRTFGPMCLGDMVGRGWLRYWPLDTIGILQTPTYPNVPR